MQDTCLDAAALRLLKHETSQRQSALHRRLGQRRLIEISFRNFLCCVGRFVCDVVFAASGSQSCPVSHGSSEAWHSFQQQRLRQSVNHTHYMTICAFGLLTSSFIVKALTKTEDFGVHAWRISVFLIMSALQRTLIKRIWASAKGSRDEWIMCLVHQAVFITSAFATATIAMRCRDEVVMHRTFILAWMMTLACMTGIVYMPRPWHLLFVSSQGMLIWAVFHVITGWTRPVAQFWGFALVAGELAVFHSSETKDWNFFQVAEHEYHQRLKSQALEEALRVMLHAVFDASCECDELGTFIKTSRHLQDLIGINLHEHDGLTLTSLAATPFESERIAALLSQITSVESRIEAEQSLSPPTLLETSFKAFDQAVPEIRVKLCCVRLPLDTVAGETLAPVEERLPKQRLLVGLQRVQAPDMGVSLSDGSPQAQLFDAGTAVCPQEANLHDDCKSTERKLEEGHGLRRRVAAGLTNSSLALITKTSDFGRKIIDFDERTYESGSLASLSLSGTHVTDGKHSRFVLDSHIDVETQTIATHLFPHVDTRNQAVQTELPSSTRPPLPMGTVTLSQQSQTRERKHTKKTSRPFLANWCGTPAATIEFMMSEALIQVNPMGEGCCFEHVTMHCLLAVLKSMALRKCRKQIVPHPYWQCQECWALNGNEFDDDDDEEDGDVCSVCTQPRPMMKEGDAGAEAVDGDSDFADGSVSAVESDFSTQGVGET